MPAISRRFAMLVLGAACLLLSHATPAQSADQVDSVHERWSAEGQGGTPEFQRHVVPLIGKLGCNGRACHGSFQGQNGFQLSLFGHDPRMDHKELTKDEGDGARVDVRDPESSLALFKPTHADEHEGGQRLEKQSWQYRLLLEWIAAGAPFNAGRESTLARLEVEPSELRLEGDAKSPVQLRTIAHFSDNTTEDVTALTLFSTNDESVAQVNGDGQVTARSSGGTAIVATFAGAVVTSRVIVPNKSLTQFADFPHNNRVDELVIANLKKLGIHPSDLASDRVFLRRAYLDVIGTLPTSAEVQRFLANDTVDKRTKLIDELLDRPEYAMYWATKFGDWTGNDNRFTPQPRAKTAWLWHDWLRDKLDRNVPYDEIVGGFVTATTREGRPIEEVAKEHVTINKNLAKGFDDGTYASRRTNDVFWQKAGNTRPDTVGLRMAYAFLGVRLECAQCHKHPFDRWTQDDFRGFTAIFANMGRAVPKDVPKELKKNKGRQSYRYREVYVDTSRAAIRKRKKQPPKLLGGESIAFENGEDPRAALLEWMVAPDNPYFAPAIANRLWGHYFGVGIVDPVDDFNAANPPSNPALLAWLAQHFVEHAFDLKHLHRTILNSRTYQLSWQPNDSNRLDERHFSHALLRRMPAEVVVDAINQVTGSSENYGNSNAPRGTRAINLAPTRLRNSGPEYAFGIFGRPLRTQTCDCERSVETGLAQAMYLLNDTDVNAKITNRKGRLTKLMRKIKDDGALVDELYLSTLSRWPTDDERQRTLEFVSAAESRTAGMQDVLWSLLNVREFVFVH